VCSFLVLLISDLFEELTMPKKSIFGQILIFLKPKPEEFFNRQYQYKKLLFLFLFFLVGI